MKIFLQSNLLKPLSSAKDPDRNQVLQMTDIPGRLFSYTCIMMACVSIWGATIVNAYAGDVINLTQPIERIKTANTDSQYEAALSDYNKIVKDSPCEKAVFEFINFRFEMLYLADAHFKYNRITLVNLLDKKDWLESTYGTIDEIAERIVLLCGGKKEGLFVLVDELSDSGWLSDEPEKSALTVLRFKSLTKD